MGLSSQAYMEINKKSKLEERLSAEVDAVRQKAVTAEKRRNEINRRAAEKERARTAAQLKNLLARLAKEIDIDFTDSHAHFIFHNQPWFVIYSHWTVGEQGVDCWETQHEGWKLMGPFPGSHTLYEVEEYSTPKKLGPKELSTAVEGCLRAYLRDNGRDTFGWPKAK